MVSCNFCGAIFTRRSNLKRHIERMHTYTRPRHICILCKKAFISLRSFNYHKQSHKPTDNHFHLIRQGLNNTCQVYQKVFNNNIATTTEAYDSVKSSIRNFLKYQLLQQKSFKCQSILIVELVKLDATNTYVEDRFEFYVRSSSHLITSLRDVRRFIRVSRIETELRVDDFVSHGTGWRLNDVIALNLELGKCKPLNAGCDLTKEKKIVIKKINELYKLLPQNSFFDETGLHNQYKRKLKQTCDNKCFLEAIASFFLKKQRKDITKSNIKKFIKKKLNVKVNFPIKLTSIKKFERDNKLLNLKINVLIASCDVEENIFNIYPIYVNPFKKSENIINLLYYETKTLSKTNNCHKVDGHFLLIDNVSNFLNSKHRSNHKFFCINCLNGFSRRTTLKRHERLCFEFKPQVVRAPEPPFNYVYLKNFDCFL